MPVRLVISVPFLLGRQRGSVGIGSESKLPQRKEGREIGREGGTEEERVYMSNPAS